MISTSYTSEKIRAEQIAHIYNQTPVFVPMVLFASLSTIFMLWPATTPLIAIIWCAWIWVLYGSFLLLYKRWKKASPASNELNPWANIYIAMSWLATASWGIIGVIFFHPDSLMHLSLLVIILVLGVAAITTTSTAFSPTFYPVILMLMPLSSRLVYEDQVIYLLLSFGLLMFTVMMFFLHKNSHKVYESALRLRFENESLVQQLALQKNIAEKANVDKSKFLATVTHDLRQPLHAMNLFHGELTLNLNNAEQREILVQRLGESIYSMHEFFNCILDVSRFEVGVVQPNITCFKVSKLFESLYNEFNAKAEEKGLRFHCVNSCLEVKSDFVLLRRIMSNLIENAIAFTPSGKVLLGCRRRGNELVLQVLDTGKGIPDASKDEIFTIFQQLSTGDVENNGLGLGLSVVKQLSESLNHKLTMKSVEGRGSIFELALPVLN